MTCCLCYCINRGTLVWSISGLPTTRCHACDHAFGGDPRDDLVLYAVVPHEKLDCVLSAGFIAASSGDDIDTPQTIIGDAQINDFNTDYLDRSSVQTAHCSLALRIPRGTQETHE